MQAYRRPTVRFREESDLPGGGRLVRITQPGGPAPYQSGERTAQLMGRVVSGGLGEQVLSNQDIGEIFNRTLDTLGELEENDDG
jgi:hypothetical protein